MPLVDDVIDEHTLGHFRGRRSRGSYGGWTSPNSHVNALMVPGGGGGGTALVGVLSLVVVQFEGDSMQDLLAGILLSFSSRRLFVAGRMTFAGAAVDLLAWDGLERLGGCTTLHEWPRASGLSRARRTSTSIPSA